MLFSIENSMKLTPQQEKEIEEYVDRNGIEIVSLRDDIIDHLCCVVESQLGKGKTFDQLLIEAVSDIAPDGLEAVEQKTIFLLNAKRIIIMKKAIYIVVLLGIFVFL